jgi:SAM-dependent methyltransferase
MNVFKSKEFAHQWHHHVKGNSAMRTQLLNPEIESKMGSLRDNTVLDAGCGSGFSTRLLLESSPREVFAFDINPHLVKIAREEIAGAGFLVADAARLPFRSEFFDLILCYNVLMNIKSSKLPETLEEFHRVMKKDGTLLAVLVHPLYNLFANQKSRDGDGYRQMKLYGVEEEIRVDSIPGFEDFQEWRRPLSWYSGLFSKNGFATEDFQEIFLAPFENMPEKYNWRLGYPVFAIFALEKK